MIRFKDYIEEAYLDNTTGSPKQRKMWNTSRSEAKLNSSRTSMVGETLDHTIHKIDKGEEEDGTNTVAYYSKHKASKRIDATINGSEKGNSIHIDSMATHPDGHMKMHHLIHHLVHAHGKMVGASHFSPGGKRVMDKVGGMEGVELTHWKDKKKVTPKDAYTDKEDTDKHDAVYVVAGKKQ